MFKNLPLKVYCKKYTSKKGKGERVYRTLRLPELLNSYVPKEAEFFIDFDPNKPNQIIINVIKKEDLI